MAIHTARTSTDAGHSHGFRVDGDGHGETCPDGEHVHVHRIVGGKVQSYEGHTHTLPEVPKPESEPGKADPIRR